MSEPTLTEAIEPEEQPPEPCMWQAPMGGAIAQACPECGHADFVHSHPSAEENTGCAACRALHEIRVLAMAELARLELHEGQVLAVIAPGDVLYDEFSEAVIDTIRPVCDAVRINAIVMPHGTQLAVVEQVDVESEHPRGGEHAV